MWLVARRGLDMHIYSTYGNAISYMLKGTVAWDFWAQVFQKMNGLKALNFSRKILLNLAPISQRYSHKLIHFLNYEMQKVKVRKILQEFPVNICKYETRKLNTFWVIKRGKRPLFGSCSFPNSTTRKVITFLVLQYGKWFEQQIFESFSAFIKLEKHR